MQCFETDLVDAVLLTLDTRAMAGEQRLRLAFEMSCCCKELIKARIRREHPDWNEKLVSRDLLRLEFLPDPLPPGF